MKTISVAVNDKLYKSAKAEAVKRRKTVSALVRELLTEASASQIKALERRHAEGYARNPVGAEEFEISESERVWGQS